MSYIARHYHINTIARFMLKGTQFTGFKKMALVFWNFGLRKYPHFKTPEEKKRSWKPPPKKDTGTAFCVGPLEKVGVKQEKVGHVRWANA